LVGSGRATAPPASVAEVKRPRATRAEILAATASIIVERGYKACTMREIAGRINVKAGSLYYHFPSKEQIVEEILTSGIEELHEYVRKAIDEVPPEAPFPSKLEAAVSAHLSCMIQSDKKLMQVYEHLPPAVKRKGRRVREKYAKLWLDLFADGVRRNEVDPYVSLKLLVPYLLGGLNGVPDWLRSSGSSSKDVASLATSVFLHGVGRPR
jgi:TetR/AcrR family transcriptional regulator, cholesterol catabolism regulator